MGIGLTSEVNGWLFLEMHKIMLQEQHERTKHAGLSRAPKRVYIRLAFACTAFLRRL